MLSVLADDNLSLIPVVMGSNPTDDSVWVILMICPSMILDVKRDSKSNFLTLDKRNKHFLQDFMAILN